MIWVNALLEWLQREAVRIVYRAAPLLIVLLAALLRFHLLGNQSLWNDEGNSLRLAERAIPDLLAAARLDIHPPGYYLALKGWLALTGESEFALRALSALAGVVTVACVYMLGQALFSRGAGIVAALMVAVNGFSVYYGQEARMYAALALFGAASMLVFVRYMEKPTWRRGLALAVLNAAGLYTQYAFPAVIVAQAVMAVVWLLTSLPAPLSASSEGEPVRSILRRLGAYVALNAITLLLFAPQLGSALAQVATWPRTGQAVEAGAGLETLARWLVYGKTLPVLNGWAFVWPGLFALAALLPDWIQRPRGYPSSWWRRTLPWIWLAATVLPFLALGLFREANLKFLLPVQIAAALLVGRGVWLLWEIGSPNLFLWREALPRIAAGLGLLSIAGFYNDGLDNLYHRPQYARPDYRAIARQIESLARPGDAIILDAPNQEEVFRYYYRGEAPIHPLPRGLGGDDPAAIAGTREVIRGARRIFVVYWGEAERDPNRVVEKTLAAETFEVSSSWYGDVRLVRYATLPKSAAAPLQIGARFGESISLESAALTATTIQPGEVLGVTLVWRTERTLSRRYKVFVQLLDREGKLVAQRDAEPGNNLAITPTWQPGVPVSDGHGLLIPANLPPGEYRLIVGLYDLEPPNIRLPQGQRDYQDLGTIRVSP